MSLRLAAASGQALSLVVFVMVAIWYVVPWMRRRERPDALTPLLWVHVFRYVALHIFAAQQAGFPISDGGSAQILYGDLVGMSLAMLAIAALRYRARVSIPLVWLHMGDPEWLSLGDR